MEENVANPPPPVVVFDALPKDEPHGWKFLTLGRDGWVYFQIGSPGNIVMPPSTHASIMRLDPERKVMENVVLGVRNSVGMDFHPVTKQLWFTNNGRDWVNDDLPNDTLHRVTAKGQHFGFPYCHQGDLLDPEFGKGRSCSEFAPPAADAPAGEAKAQVCAACHGPGGNSTDPQFPSLAAQPPIYVFYQLLQFREQRRKDARMSPFAEKLTDADMKDIAAYYAAQKPAAPMLAADPAKVAAGNAIAQRFYFSSCPTSTFAGQNHIARLARQPYDYLVKELRGLKTGPRPAS